MWKKLYSTTRICSVLFFFFFLFFFFCGDDMLLCNSFGFAKGLSFVLFSNPIYWHSFSFHETSPIVLTSLCRNAFDPVLIPADELWCDSPQRPTPRHMAPSPVRRRSGLFLNSTGNPLLRLLEQLLLSKVCILIPSQDLTRTIWCICA